MKHLDIFAVMKNWLWVHKKKVIVHTIILSCFVLYALYLADPLFDRFEINTFLESRQYHGRLSAGTKNLKCHIGLIIPETHAIRVYGWAFIEGEDSDNSRTYVVLKSKEKTCVFDSFVDERPDVQEHFKDMHLDLIESGFMAIIPLRKIPDGEYSIGLYIKKGKIKALKYHCTEYTIKKSKDIAKVAYNSSELRRISLSSEGGMMKFHIGRVGEVVRGAERLIELAGWAFIEGENSVNGRIYLVPKTDFILKRIASGLEISNIFRI